MMQNERIRWPAECWDLVECTFTAGDGTLRTPRGRHRPASSSSRRRGSSRLTAGGETARHIRATNRRPARSSRRDDYFSYFGRIVRVDDDTGRFVTAVDGATDLGWIGSEQRRYLDVEDDDHIVPRTPPSRSRAAKSSGA